METLAKLPPTPDPYAHLALSGGQELKIAEEALIGIIEAQLEHVPAGI